MNPEGFSDTKLFGETVNKELLNVTGYKVLEYVKRSMQGVGKEYTDKSIAAGNNVKDHLKNVLTEVTYEFQGSVMTNTHIKGNSDIDLLLLCDKFYYSDNDGIKSKFSDSLLKSELNSFQIERLQSHVTNAGQYKGDGDADLKAIRLSSEKKLMEVYYVTDISKPKCIRIKNQSLHRDVDVVIASWYKTFEGIKDRDTKRNHIRIYDKDLNSVGRIESPFITIDRINNKNSTVNGRLKKMIRFVKTLKADSVYADQIDLSSFELNAICYNIDIFDYMTKPFYDLVPVLGNEFGRIVSDPIYRDKIKSIDGSEDIFKGKPEKVNSLRLLLKEIMDVLNDMNINLIPSYVN